MSRFIDEADRSQGTLLPETIDEYVCGDNPVRVIDAFVGWLVGRLAPDFKTLADFRAENTVAIKNVCREFIVLCRRWNLFTEATVAIDASKFKAVNHRDRNFTSGKMQTRMALIEQSIVARSDGSSRDAERPPADGTAQGSASRRSRTR